MDIITHTHTHTYLAALWLVLAVCRPRLCACASAGRWRQCLVWCSNSLRGYSTSQYGHGTGMAACFFLHALTWNFMLAGKNCCPHILQVIARRGGPRKAMVLGAWRLGAGRAHKACNCW